MKAQLVITLEDNGSVSVNGPIGDPVLAYGMLEAGRDAIQSFNAQQALRQAMRGGHNGSGIVVARPGLPRELKGA